MAKKVRQGEEEEVAQSQEARRREASPPRREDVELPAQLNSAEEGECFAEHVHTISDSQLASLAQCICCGSLGSLKSSGWKQ
ncbi:hypothetical protein STEG23_005087 [Scotinomys teguina]